MLINISIFKQYRPLFSVFKQTLILSIIIRIGLMVDYNVRPI